MSSFMKGCSAVCQLLVYVGIEAEKELHHVIVVVSYRCGDVMTQAEKIDLIEEYLVLASQDNCNYTILSFSQM